jgi:transcriptional regulator with XRE-family HTH domain
MTDEQFLESLGKKIAALREKKGISQNEFAKRLDTWNNQIRRIEKGLVGANIITLRKIAKELDVPLSTLVNVK